MTSDTTTPLLRKQCKMETTYLMCVHFLVPIVYTVACKYLLLFGTLLMLPQKSQSEVTALFISFLYATKLHPPQFRSHVAHMHTLLYRGPQVHFITVFFHERNTASRNKT